MIDAEVLEMIRDARGHAQSLGIRPNPVLSVHGAIERVGVDLGALAKDPKRRSPFWALHEAMECTYRNPRADLQPFGRELLCNEGAADMLAPADILQSVIEANGYDLMMMRSAAGSREPSHELIARRIPLLAAEREDHVIVTIVDDGRIHWRSQSTDPLARWGVPHILPQEVSAWSRCARVDPRRYEEWSGGASPVPIYLAGRRPEMPTAAADPSDVWGGPTIDVRCWPIPPRDDGMGPRREIMVTQVGQ